jgi:hypothetical protein
VARGWRGTEPERLVSDRSTDLCYGVPETVLGPSANGGFQIADRTLLARSASAAERRERLLLAREPASDVTNAPDPDPGGFDHPLARVDGDFALVQHT